jgi:hypothetical protein
MNTKLALVLAQPLLLALALPVLAETYDGFNKSRWQILVDGSNPVVKETNNRLEIQLPADSMESVTSGTFIGTHTSVCKLRGDFDVRVNYSLPEFPEFNGVRVGLSVTETSNPLVAPRAIERTSFSHHDVFPAGEAYLTDFGGVISGPVPTADLHGRLRLERVGNSLTGYYFDSQLGAWQAIAATAYTSEDVFFSIAAWSHDYAFDDRDVVVAFDKVFIKKGSLVGACKG